MDGSQHAITDVIVGRIVAVAGAEITVLLDESASGNSAKQAGSLQQSIIT